MTGREIFEIWAPTGAKWVDWVRPVPFIQINDNLKIYENIDFTINKVNYINNMPKDTAIIVDLPGNESIEEGIALSKIGYRPIPVYNGTNEQEGAIATTDNHSIEAGLIWGALELKKTQISDNAPPTFLLDTNRMNRYKMNVSVFDNSWDIYDQDIPSAEYFIKNGIDKIVVRSQSIQKDLKIILYEFQKKGIKIFFTKGYDEEPKKVTIRKQIIK